MSSLLLELQRHLLLQPNDQRGWEQLEVLLGKSETTEPAVSELAPTIGVPPSIQQQPATATSLDQQPSRPLRAKFHPVGSEEHERVLAQQSDEIKAALEAGRADWVLSRLGKELVPLLVVQLQPKELYLIGELSHRRERHDLAVPLLEGLADREDAGDLGPWASLFAARSRLGLGNCGEGRQRLRMLALEPEREHGFHACLSLAWLNLNAGDHKTAQARLETLKGSPHCGAHEAEVDLVGRVLSTLGWLESSDRGSLNNSRDLAAECGFVAAVDALRLSSCGTLLQIEGWVVDPGQQLEHLCLIRGQRAEWLNLAQAQYRYRADLAEVLSCCGAPHEHDAGFTLTVVQGEESVQPLEPGEAGELLFVLRNGEQFCLRRTISATALETEQLKGVLDGAINNQCELVAAAALDQVREAWSRKLLGRLAEKAAHQVHGLRVEDPELSVVIPLYGRIDFMEYQLNWFNAWKRRQQQKPLVVQLIYVLDDPRLQESFQALVKRCQALYRVPFETVINPHNLGFAGANNRGAALARAPHLLLLNSDVLPAHDGSFEQMLRAMHSHGGTIGALGARLLYDNGGIQHVGMEFVREDDLEGELGRVWLNEHPLKGVNAGFTAQERLELQEVEAATAACLMLSTDRFRSLGGLSSHYVVGDFEDSDLCLKVRREGLGIYIDLAATFFHLERQSVGLNEQSDLLKTKVVCANALTHHQRWASTIERLKRCQVQA